MRTTGAAWSPPTTRAWGCVDSRRLRQDAAGAQLPPAHGVHDRGAVAADAGRRAQRRHRHRELPDRGSLVAGSPRVALAQARAGELVYAVVRCQRMRAPAGRKHGHGRGVVVRVGRDHPLGRVGKGEARKAVPDLWPVPCWCRRLRHVPLLTRCRASRPPNFRHFRRVRRVGADPFADTRYPLARFRCVPLWPVPRQVPPSHSPVEATSDRTRRYYRRRVAGGGGA
jgi:hypothetical protein